ncbi:hypothetical protein Ddc_02547 [Ditylenchus destructor]|nr:hypothetical protein Ddc_02547 [Ditylenchus destructor]
MNHISLVLLCILSTAASLNLPYHRLFRQYQDQLIGRLSPSGSYSMSAPEDSENSDDGGLEDRSKRFAASIYRPIPFFPIRHLSERHLILPPEGQAQRHPASLRFDPNRVLWR